MAVTSSSSSVLPPVSTVLSSIPSYSVHETLATVLSVASSLPASSSLADGTKNDGVGGEKTGSLGKNLQFNLVARLILSLTKVRLIPLPE